MCMLEIQSGLKNLTAFTKHYKAKHYLKDEEWKMEKYLIRYKQKFAGKVLEDSYIKYVRSYDEIDMAIQALYEDSCVFHVEAIKLGDDQNGGEDDEPI